MSHNKLFYCVSKKKLLFQLEKSIIFSNLRIVIKPQRNRTLNYHTNKRYSRISWAHPKMAGKWAERAHPPYALAQGTLPIVRDNYRINKFTSWRNAYNISTSAKWYRDTVVYHRGSYSPRPATHCRAYVVSRYPFGSYPPRCSMARIVRHARSMPLKNRACLSGNC